MNYELKQYTCIQCGHKWSPRKDNPTHCPKCRTSHWKKDNKVLPIPTTSCKKCGYTWQPRVASVAQCPYCKFKFRD